MLLGAAFHELATAIRLMDPERGHALLHELQKGVATTLKSFVADQPEMAGSPILHEAASRVRTVMRAAQGLEESEGDQ